MELAGVAPGAAMPLVHSARSPTSNDATMTNKSPIKWFRGHDVQVLGHKITDLSGQLAPMWGVGIVDHPEGFPGPKNNYSNSCQPLLTSIGHTNPPSASADI